MVALRLELAERELDRAQALKRRDFGTGQNVDQRTAEKRAAQAALDDAQGRSVTLNSTSSIAASQRPLLGASASTLSPSATWLQAAVPQQARPHCWRRSSLSTPFTWIST
jgi:multidrug resistance efflux pump